MDSVGSGIGTGAGSFKHGDEPLSSVATEIVIMFCTALWMS
jgi:hypothetical protein